MFPKKQQAGKAFSTKSKNSQSNKQPPKKFQQLCDIVQERLGYSASKGMGLWGRGWALGRAFVQQASQGST